MLASELVGILQKKLKVYNQDFEVVVSSQGQYNIEDIDIINDVDIGTVSDKTVF